MNRIVEGVQDVMQVCRNGHVITDLLRSCPDRGLAYCDRCGAGTIDHCLTCGHELPGSLAVPGLRPVGVRQPPCYCPTCGAAFPWTEQRRPPATQPLAVLENLLRRLPRVIRELRVRHADRPPFRVVDEKDLEDLLRALLPLHFEDIRPECRTPCYAAGTRTDFLLIPENIALTSKYAHSQVQEEIAEDVDYYRRDRKRLILVVFVYDPEARLREPNLLLASEEGPEVRCVVGVP